MENIQSIWLTLLIAAVSGLVASLASPFVNHFVQNLKDEHNRKQRILDKMSDIVSKVVADDFGKGSNFDIYKADLYKGSNQLLGMGLLDLSTIVSLFKDYWEDIHKLGTSEDRIKDIKKDAKKVAEEITTYKT